MLRVLRETKYLSNMQLHTSEEALKWKLDEEIQIYLRSSSGGQTVWLRCTVVTSVLHALLHLLPPNMSSDLYKNSGGAEF